LKFVNEFYPVNRRLQQQQQPFYGNFFWTTRLSRYQKKHSLTPILIINQTLLASSIYYDPYHLPCSIYVLDSLLHNFSTTALWSASWSGTFHFIVHATIKVMDNGPSSVQFIIPLGVTDALGRMISGVCDFVTYLNDFIKETNLLINCNVCYLNFYISSKPWFYTFSFTIS